MSFRRVTKIAATVCVRSDTRHRCALQLAATFSMDSTRPMHLSSAHTQSWGLRVEGIQGPMSALPSLKESRNILEAAVTYANTGFSQQGVQGAIHTEEARRYSSDCKGSAGIQELDDTVCPQGVQGDVGENCHYFNAWLTNCRRYGLQDCDQLLQGIQSGRRSLSEVLADQEVRIAEIAANFRERARKQSPQANSHSIQGAQGETGVTEEVDTDMLTPQGVQGDDCVRFRLWLETCTRFKLHECAEQLQGFQEGRVTLKEIFDQQDALIKQIVEEYKSKK